MAPRSKRTSAPSKLAEQIARELDAYATSLDEKAVRQNVQELIPIGDYLRELGASLLPGSSGKERMLGLLRAYVATPLPARELEIVSGIGEWARRIRELRVEEGWPIFSADTLSQIALEDPDQAADIEAQAGFSISHLPEETYVLLVDAKDEHAAKAWKLLNALSKEDISVRDRILAFLRANVGHPVSGEQLRYLAKGKTEWARRTRELRTEEGWPVQTRMQGRPDVPVGYYVLAEDRQAPPHDRKIPDPVRSLVLKRDGFQCRWCGWSKTTGHPDDPKQFLELHHLKEHAKAGANTAENLVTLCNVDHREYHAGRLTFPVDWPG